MVMAKCVLCSKSFNKEDLIAHYVDIHNVPRGDAILNRYVNLRFSSPSGDMRASKLKILIDLLKLLKQRAAKYTAERTKIKLNKSKIQSLFYEFINFEDVDSEFSTNSFVGEEPERLTLVNWFLSYYNIFINNDTVVLSKEGNKNIVSFYTEEERDRIKCSRITVQKKENLDLDFNDQSKIPQTGSSPYENFSTMIKTMFLKFFSNLIKKENSCQIMFEITTEFVKSEEESEIYEFEENQDGTSDMYAECKERRVVKTYSALTFGHILNIKRIFQEGLSDISRKVLNSFNVTGSNWSLRSILNLNLIIVYDIKYFSSISRLVKGKIPLSSNEAKNTIARKNFAKFFEVCYQQVRMSRNTRIKMARLMKGQAAVLSRKKIPGLDFQDREAINFFTKTFFKSEKKKLHNLTYDNRQKKHTLNTLPDLEGKSEFEEEVVVDEEEVEEEVEAEGEEEEDEEEEEEEEEEENGEVIQNDVDDKNSSTHPSVQPKKNLLNSKKVINMREKLATFTGGKRTIRYQDKVQPPKKKMKKDFFTTQYIPPKVVIQKRKASSKEPVKMIFSSRNNQKDFFNLNSGKVKQEMVSNIFMYIL